jgi:phosphoribosylamine-glycine ligase
MEDGKIIKGPVYQTTGDYVCCVTSHGHDVHDAVEQVYATIDHIKFADRIARNDVGARLEKELPKLKALGYEEVPDW